MTRLALLLLPSLVACGRSEPDFLWGSATAAYQIEGGLHGSDWFQWEELGNIQGGGSADDGPNALAHVDEDLRLAREALGHNAYRFSIEWSRIEPSEGRYDPEGLAAYHRVLAACRAQKLTPLVTLSHFTLPTWLHDVKTRAEDRLGWAGGGSAPGDGRIVGAFERFAADMAKEFGGEVDRWIPLNEPMVQLVATYMNPTDHENERFPRPPRQVAEPALDLTRTVHAATNMMFAHARAYDAIHAFDTVDADGDSVAATVGIAQHMRHMLPAEEGADFQAAARHAEYAFNFLFLDAVTRGDLDLTLDGQFTEVGEGQAVSELKDRLDFIGVNYYSRADVYPVTFNAKAPYSESTFALRAIASETNESDLPKSELGWDLWAPGLYEVLMRAHQRYGLPLLVTENGIADSNDDQRPRYIVDHVRELLRAKESGADIRGYLHWTLMDNFEWVRGYAPRFGLLRVDFADPQRARTVTPGAQALRDIIEAGGVTEALLERSP